MTARPTYTAANSRVQERGHYAEPDRGDASRCMGIVLLCLIVAVSLGLGFAVKGLF